MLHEVLQQYVQIRGIAALCITPMQCAHNNVYKHEDLASTQSFLLFHPRYDGRPRLMTPDLQERPPGKNRR